MKYGTWQYDPDTMLLSLERDGKSLYEVPLYECSTSAVALDWIMQVTMKTWATDADLAGLLRAIRAVINPQAHLCGSGVERGPVKWVKGRATRA
jgi:hypothetical protein